MYTYMAVITDYTTSRLGEIIAIIKQPLQHLGKDFLRKVAWCMWSECFYNDGSRDLCATIYKNGSYVAIMATAYLASYQRVHTTICGRFPSETCTFRAFNHPAQHPAQSDEITIPPYNPTNK